MNVIRRILPWGVIVSYLKHIIRTNEIRYRAIKGINLRLLDWSQDFKVSNWNILATTVVNNN